MEKGVSFLWGWGMGRVMGLCYLLRKFVYFFGVKKTSFGAFWHYFE